MFLLGLVRFFYSVLAEKDVDSTMLYSNFRCLIVFRSIPVLIDPRSLIAGFFDISASNKSALLTDKLAVQVQSLYRTRQASM